MNPWAEPPARGGCCLPHSAGAAGTVGAQSRADEDRGEVMPHKLAAGLKVSSSDTENTQEGGRRGVKFKLE